MKSIYLLSLLVVLASANLGVDISNYQNAPRAFYNCLASKNVSLAILGLMDPQGNVNTNFLKNYIASRDAKIKGFDAIVVISDSFEPEDLCNEVAHALPASFNGTVWLDIESNKGLWSRNISDRIPYLENITKACQNQGLKPGVYSSAQIWAAVVGSQGTGSDTLKAVPLWYANDNGSADFDDFEYAGFGTWEKPTMKNYGGDTSICYYYVSSVNYFDA